MRPTKLRPAIDVQATRIKEPSLLAAAKGYAARGWSVVPVGLDKRPTIPWKDYQSRLPTEVELTGWFGNGNARGIGVVTGAISGLVVLDADHGSREDGSPKKGLTNAETLGALARPTLIHRSPSGGAHFFFEHPGVEIRNSQSVIAPDVDVRGDGGYVVLPPTKGYRVHQDAPLAHCPGWLRPKPEMSYEDRMAAKRKAAESLRTAFPGSTIEPVTATPYGQAALRSETQAVRETPEGKRNPQLNSSAFSLGQLVAGGQLAEGVVRDELAHAAEAAGLGGRETRATIDSGLTAGMQEPRGPVFITDDDSPVDEIPMLDAKPTRHISECIPQAGFLRELVHFVTSVAQVAPESALAMGLVQMAALTQGRLALDLGGRRWGTGLWVVLVAKAGERKSAALGYMDLLNAVDPEGQVQLITAEALDARLAQRNHLWMVHSELSQWIRAFDQSYMRGAREAFNHYWDGDKAVLLRETKAGGQVKLRYPTVSIIGATTLANLTQWASTSAILEGFLTRPLWVFQEQSPGYAGIARNPITNVATWDRLVAEITARQKMVNTRPMFGPPNPVTVTPDAIDLFEAYDRGWQSQPSLSPALDGFRNRLPAQAYRMSVGFALSRMGFVGEVLTVNGDDMSHAIAFTEWCRERSWPKIESYWSTDTWQAKDLARLRQWMDTLSPLTRDGRVTKRDLERRSHFFGRRFDETAEHLVDLGEWEMGITAPRERTRGTEWYRKANGDH